MFAGLAEVDTSYTLRWHWQVPHSPGRFLEQFLALLDGRPFAADADYDSEVAPALNEWKHGFDGSPASTPRT